MSSLPYPLPETWKLHSAQLKLRWPAVVWAAIAAVAAIAMVTANLEGNIARGVLAGAAFWAIGAALGVSYQRAGTQHGLPLLMNAVVLTRARVRPPDSWIHFFRETGPSRWMTTWFATTGILSSVSLVGTFVAVIATGGPALWWLLLLVPVLLAALVLALAGVIAIVQFVRHATFGHRHIGISLGPHGVIRYYLDEVDVWPWESIDRVEPIGKTLDKETEDFSAKLLIVATAQPQDVATNDYAIDEYQSHAWLIYTAVRFWLEHPELRGELGTTYAQRRIEGWRDAMVASAAR